ncbi:conserved hypothetical protein [uncultured Desulfobacterium sp.]|uniref:4Fe-4S Wbl-type domain-containing protein n=1 Tax=uncultured Desulfobacterium sp. TaxID=201089 RepID=A0A445MWN5_9BACT|nr:conserved hypothetical protein [uncultured Desulfobacterium sp.]
MTGHQKDCFGVLDKVFPMGDRGLREIVPDCLDCPDRVDCLKASLDTQEGLAFKSRIMERSPAHGFMNRLKRWSDRKELSMRLKKPRGNTKWQ